MGNKCLQSVQVSTGGEETKNRFNHHHEENLSNTIGFDEDDERSKCSAELPITTHEIKLLEKSWRTVGKEWEKICNLAFLRYLPPFFFNNTRWI